MGSKFDKTIDVHQAIDIHKVLNPDAIAKLDPAAIGRLVAALNAVSYDPGPNADWEQLFQQAPLDHYATLPFHTKFGPVFYRGRLDGTARVLVVGQDPATDETLARRAFVGSAGQGAQNLLTRLGLTKSYLILNTFLFGIQSGDITNAIESDATIIAYRNKLFDHAKATNKLTAIIAFGGHAQTSVTNWPGRGNLPVINVYHPSAQGGVGKSWNDQFAKAHAAIVPDSDGHVDQSKYDEAAQKPPSTDIPRRDLPFGVPAWQGTGGGTQSRRGTGAAFETQIIWDPTMT